MFKLLQRAILLSWISLTGIATKSNPTSHQQFKHLNHHNQQELYYVDKSLANDFQPIIAKSGLNTNSFHLLSHGRPGQLYINGIWMGVSEIIQFLCQNEYITSDIDIIKIYGCEFAKGVKGAMAVKELSSLLGISVAASTNITGIDGDWVLEIGNIDETNYFKSYKGNLQCTGIAGGTGPSDDFDRDGVCNSADIDDDNDGVLDAVESPDCFYSPAVLESGNRSSFVTVTTGLGMDATYNDPQELVDGDAGTTMTSWAVVFTNSQSNINSNIYTFEFQLPIELKSIYLGYMNGNSHFSNGAVVKLVGSNDGVTWTDLNAGATYNQINTSDTVLNRGIINHHVFSVTQNNDKYKYYRLNGVSGTTWDDGAANEVYFEVPSNYSTSANPKPSCTVDTDGDGVSNHLDRDSDGDSCPDAKEAGTYNQAGVTATGDSVLTNPAGGNGFADVLQKVSPDTNQYKYSYTYYIAIRRH